MYQYCHTDMVYLVLTGREGSLEVCITMHDPMGCGWLFFMHYFLLLFFLAAVSSDGCAKLWDCGSGSCLGDVASAQCPINACALSTSAMMAEKNTTEPPGTLYATRMILMLL